MARRQRKPSLSRRLHRSFGAFAAVFVLFMVVSGIAINHSNQLDLDQKPVSQPLLLDWYGIGEPGSIFSFAAGNHWLSFAGSQLYLDGHAVTAVTTGVGAVASDPGIIVASSDELVLLDNDGKLIERLAFQPIGGGSIEAIGIHPPGGVVVKSMHKTWLTDSNLLTWTVLEDTTRKSIWSRSAPAPEAIQLAITRHYRGENLNLEQLLLDLHSGRVFGSVGILIYDLLALAVGFLALSGLLLWLRGKSNGNRN